MSEEQWITDARQKAKDEAEYTRYTVNRLADKLAVDRVWFWEQFLAEINKNREKA